MRGVSVGECECFVAKKSQKQALFEKSWARPISKVLVNTHRIAGASVASPTTPQDTPPPAILLHPLHKVPFIVRINVGEECSLLPNGRRGTVSAGTVVFLPPSPEATATGGSCE